MHPNYNRVLELMVRLHCTRPSKLQIQSVARCLLPSKHARSTSFTEFCRFFNWAFLLEEPFHRRQIFRPVILKYVFRSRHVSSLANFAKTVFSQFIQSLDYLYIWLLVPKRWYFLTFSRFKLNTENKSNCVSTWCSKLN